MPTSRFQYFSPPLRTSSLRRLKTAFSTATNSYASSSASTSTTSPRSMSRNSDEFSPSSSFSASSSLSAARLRAMLILRRKPSTLDLELEEERRSFGHELDMLEPRPPMPMGFTVGGIFEVLEGRA